MAEDKEKKTVDWPDSLNDEDLTKISKIFAPKKEEP